MNTIPTTANILTIFAFGMYILQINSLTKNEELFIEICAVVKPRLQNYISL